jgi:hypothetical protein
MNDNRMTAEEILRVFRAMPESVAAKLAADMMEEVRAKRECGAEVNNKDHAEYEACRKFYHYMETPSKAWFGVEVI